MDRPVVRLGRLVVVLALYAITILVMSNLAYILALKILELLGLAGTLYFVVRYAMTARWWETIMGRNVMAFAVINLGIFALSAWSLFIGPKLPYEKLITIALLSAFVFAVWRRNAVLEIVQHQDRGDAKVQ